MKLRLLTTRHRILARPCSSPRQLRRPPENPQRPFPLDQAGVVPTFSGRAALYQAAALLGLGEGDAVLCPAYCCGHEVEPFLRRKVELRFFDVDRRLAIDIEDLRRKVDERTRAILVTHYFGFPQPLEPLRELCSERGIVLIEDCAHAFLSRDAHGPLGRTGDFAIFSQRKTLPLPHGGALLVKMPGPAPPSLERPPAVTTWVKLMRSWEQALIARTDSTAQLLGSRLLLLLYSPLSLAHRGIAWLGGSAVRDTLEGSFDYDSRVLSWQMSEPAERIVGNVDPALVVARRRSNFETLLKALAGRDDFRPLLDSLPEGVCPLVFPLLSSRAPELARRLQRSGIAASMWWDQLHPAVPWQEFPDSEYLKSHVVALPIHQDLGREHMLHTIRVLERPLA